MAMAADQSFLTAREAAERLGISTATLYAYVSRGLLRSEPGEGATRARRYGRAEVEALAARKEYRREPAKAAEESLDFGMPLLESAITLIDGGRLYYRGHDAVRLAQERSFEEVAALLWTGDLTRTELLGGPFPPLPQALLAGLPHGQPIERGQVALAGAAVDDLAAHQLTPPAVAATGARILHLLTGAMGGGPQVGGTAARGTAAAGETAAGEMAAEGTAGVLAAAWCPAQTQAARLLAAALILCADHELNVSAFTARCVASAGSSPYAVVIGGLAALQGFRHGGHTVLVAALLAEAAHGVRQAVAGYLQNGGILPGFGHRLYPQGDPRARGLLALLGEECGDAPAVVLAGEICAVVEESLGLRPTIDFALTVLAEALGAPRHAPLALFALGRTAGWIAHAIEQYGDARVIRPRARYCGVEGQRGEGGI
jgi:citrate synthase